MAAKVAWLSRFAGPRAGRWYDHEAGESAAMTGAAIRHHFGPARYRSLALARRRLGGHSAPASRNNDLGTKSHRSQNKCVLRSSASSKRDRGESPRPICATRHSPNPTGLQSVPSVLPLPAWARWVAWPQTRPETSWLFSASHYLTDDGHKAPVETS